MVQSTYLVKAQNNLSQIKNSRNTFILLTILGYVGTDLFIGTGESVVCNLSFL